MAKFKALQNFMAIEEGVTYHAGQEFDMTVARANELQANVNRDFPEAGKVWERIEEPKEDKEEVKEPKEAKEGK